jgi:DNA gyrase inhibitor GyrI
MTDLEVKMIDLESMHVVVATGYGAEPETQAWASILEFAEERHMDPWDSSHRFFGFNNPDPDPQHIDYGYEQWMTVPDNIEATPPLETKDFSGGRYAMVAIHGLDTIGDSWQYLADWCDSHGYEIDLRRDTCLEELVGPLDVAPSEWDMNLYLAVTES